MVIHREDDLTSRLMYRQENHKVERCGGLKASQSSA
jgi:hypothetical protein